MNWFQICAKREVKARTGTVTRTGGDASFLFTRIFQTWMVSYVSLQTVQAEVRSVRQSGPSHSGWNAGRVRTKNGVMAVEAERGVAELNR